MQLNEIIKVGVVSSVDETMGTARVRFEERDDIVSYDLSILHRKTKEDKSYYMVDINEEVLCIFLPDDLSEGFIIGAIYNSEDKIPEGANKDKKIWLFKDGSRFEYDRSTGKLLCDVVSEIVLKSPKIIMETNTTLIKGNSIKLDAGTIELTGTTNIGGKTNMKSGASVTGNIDISGVSKAKAHIS